MGLGLQEWPKISKDGERSTEGEHHPDHGEGDVAPFQQQRRHRAGCAACCAVAESVAPVGGGLFDIFRRNRTKGKATARATPDEFGAKFFAP